jgi:ankyrin repeat protein
MEMEPPTKKSKLDHINFHPDDEHIFEIVEYVNKCIHERNFNGLLKCSKFYFRGLLNPKKFFKNAPINVLKHFIDKCENLDCLSSYHGWYLIHHVIYGCNPEVIKYLIDKKIDLEICNLDFERPIHFAIKYSTPEIIKLLINKKVNLDQVNDGETSLLHCAIEFSILEIIKIFTNENSVNHLDHQKWNALHYAARYSNLKVFEFLVKSGADLSAVNVYDQYPIHLALHHGKNDIAKWIMDIDPEQCYKFDRLGFNAIHLIVSHSDCMTLKYFIDKFMIQEYHANFIDCSTSLAHDNILHLALKRGDRKMIEYVISISSKYIFDRQNIFRESFDSLIDGMELKKCYLQLKNERLAQLDRQ